MSHRSALRGPLLYLLALGLLGPLHLSAEAPPRAAARPKVAPARPVAPTLKAGDPAPVFTVGRWLKGTPVTAFQPGRVYVVECWATWCGPCRAAMPHLTELAKAYGDKVTFIGVNVWEKGRDAEQIDQRVAAFVEQMGAKLGYSVCRDSADEHMVKAWLTASGVDGIPHSFVVDGRGRIAWMGHPDGLEDVLDKVVAGTFDLEEYQRAQKADWKALEPVRAALKAKAWTKVLEGVDALKLNAGSLRRVAGEWRFVALLHADDGKAQAEFERRRAEGGDGAENAAVMVLFESGLAKAWYLRAAEIFAARATENPSRFGDEAKARFQGGDLKGAAQAQERYLAWLAPEARKAAEANPPEKKMIDQMLRRERQTLKRYQAAK